MPYILKITKEKPPIEFLSLGELAEICGKSKEALKKLIFRGILPDANFRTPRIKSKTGDMIEGYRLYSKDILVPKLSEYIKKNIHRGKLITIEQRSELINLFEEEREYFNNYKNS